MARGRQGVRSSRTGPILPLDRRQMRRLDRAISRLDRAIWIQEVCNPWLAEKYKEKRKRADTQRLWLRNWMKHTAESEVGDEWKC